MSASVTPGKKAALALALASGMSVPAAAEQAQVCDRTVRRRLANPAFRRLVARLRGQMLEAALGRLAGNMTRAPDQVARLLDSASEAVALRAARALLTVGLRLRDSVELADRIHEIEREVDRRKGVTP